MLLTDTHCHLDLDKFSNDRYDVITRAKEAGVIRILVPGLNYQSSSDAIHLTESDDTIFAAVGFHPTDLDKLTGQTLNALQDLAKHPKVVAVGEIGLDYYWIKEDHQRKIQCEVLERQLTIATLINKPVIIHMREENDKWFGQASDDLLKILSGWQKRLVVENHPLKDRLGVFHAFNGTFETALKAIDMGFYIGIAGPVTYKNADEKRRVVHQLPLERILIETDSPFLTPVPHRGKRNEPAFVREIADKIAEVKSCNLEEVAEVTTMNAARLFLW